jgi:8-oxo-dGTP pyrophosphatase MutT (NUDIX family)
MTDTPLAGTMQDARLIETEVLVPKPKRFVREALVMPDGYECDWYYVDTPPSVMVVPVTADRRLVLVRQYRHNLKSYQLEFPAGTMHETEDAEVAARRELEEETGFTPTAPGPMRPLGSFYSLPSETNKYTHVFLASPVEQSGPARLDAEIEKYFDISVVLLPVQEALDGIGTVITSMETVGALMVARTRLP